MDLPVELLPKFNFTKGSGKNLLCGRWVGRTSKAQSGRSPNVLCGDLHCFPPPVGAGWQLSPKNEINPLRNAVTGHSRTWETQRATFPSPDSWPPVSRSHRFPARNNISAFEITLGFSPKCSAVCSRWNRGGSKYRSFLPLPKVEGGSGVHRGDGRKSATFQEKAKLEVAVSTVAAEVSLTLCLWWHRLSGHTPPTRTQDAGTKDAPNTVSLESHSVNTDWASALEQDRGGCHKDSGEVGDTVRVAWMPWWGDRGGPSPPGEGRKAARVSGGGQPSLEKGWSGKACLERGGDWEGDV